MGRMCQAVLVLSDVESQQSLLGFVFLALLLLFLRSSNLEIWELLPVRSLLQVARVSEGEIETSDDLKRTKVRLTLAEPS